jgi:hypothetical protein
LAKAFRSLSQAAKTKSHKRNKNYFHPDPDEIQSRSTTLSEHQCCGSELIFFGFGSTHFFSDSDPYTNILTRNFLKWCLSLLLYVLWNLYDREKSFPTEKKRWFFLSV